MFKILSQISKGMLLLCFTFFIVAFSNKKKSRLKKDVQTYNYVTKVVSKGSITVDALSSVSVKKLANRNYLFTEKVEELIMSMNGNGFSLHALQDPTDEIFYLQHFLKNTEFSREITPEGQVVWKTDIDSLINQSFNSDELEEVWDEFSSFMDYTPELKFFKQSLPLGEVIKDTLVVSSSPLSEYADKIVKEETYKVSAIKDSLTFLILEGKTTLYHDYYSQEEESYTSEGVLIVNNETGLPVYFVEIYDVEGSILVVEHKQEQAPWSINFYDDIFYSDYFEEVEIDEDEYVFDYPSKNSVEEFVNSLMLKGELTRDTRFRSMNDAVYVAISSEKEFNMILNVKSVDCLYCNQERVRFSGFGVEPIYFPNSFPLPDFLLYTGSAFELESLSIDFEGSAYYGQKVLSFSKGDVGKVFKTIMGDFEIMEWEKNQAIISGFFGFKMYDETDSLITNFRVKFIYPQFEIAAEMLEIPIDSVTNEQAFLYGRILGDCKTAYYFDLRTDKTIDRFELTSYEDAITFQKSLLLKHEDSENDQYSEEESTPSEEIREEAEDYYEEEDFGVEIVETEESSWQSEELPQDQEVDIYIIVEDMPSFPGGPTGMHNFITESIQYPQEARDMGIQGRVYVQFVIEKDGSVSHSQVLRGVDPSLDKEALRIVNSMPHWTPGYQGGEPVRVQYTIPVSFILPED